MKILLIGCSGFLSGTVARTALAAGHQVWGVSRGRKALPSGVHEIRADRKDADGFRQAVTDAGVSWDLAIDGIAYAAEDVAQDLAVLPSCVGQLVVVSTDFVFSPAARQFPQPEDGVFVGDGYGGGKRACELLLSDAGVSALPWTVVRPGHIYGPGSQLGCLPTHGRDPELLSRLRAGQPLRLVGGGYFLQQPVLAADLAEAILSCAGNARTHGQIYNLAGPEIVESHTYYRLIAAHLGVPVTIEELPVGAYLAENPDHASFLCHRIYDLVKARRDGLRLPSTSLRDGLAQHVDSLL